MLSVFSVLTTPKKILKQLNTIISTFLWNGTDKIARLAAVNEGGLNLMHLKTYVKPSRFAWLDRIFRVVPMKSLYTKKGLWFCRCSGYLSVHTCEDCLIRNVDQKFPVQNIINYTCNITSTYFLRAKIGYAQDDSCTFCGISSEAANHLF